MKRTFLFFCIIFISVFLTAINEDVVYSDNWNQHGFSVEVQNSNSLKLNYSIEKFQFSEIEIDNEVLTNINLPGVFLPNDEGMPNLPGSSRYIAVPQNARVELQIADYRIERYSNINIASAPRIPLDTEDGPLEYNRNSKIYNSNKLYPESFIRLSEKTELRGVDVVMLGITPFQYNPVTKELLVYKDIKVNVNFVGGNGRFGEDRLRSRWWDPILSDAILNQDMLPEIDFNNRETARDGAEYVIICPDDATFLSWADSIKTFRQKQGISTMIVTTTDIGGNTVSAIEAYIDNAYNNWSTPPAAVLLLADYATDNAGINSQIYTHPAGYPDFVSDNIFADEDGDDLPDIVFARITANNAAQLETMITKFLDYERNPPNDPDFYDHPITALGWQTERWFQICSEVVGGYFKEVLDKNPVRINKVYSGTPGSEWSTATNTATVVNYFGPSGLGYIPASPATLGNWDGGTAQDVADAINAGSFLLQHRDHGNYTGWGEPAFQSSSIDLLTNTGTNLPFIFSINCQTGAFHRSSECFTEKFHRYTYNGQNSGALGVLAATEVSYSFVNDTFVWGVMDNMYPDFMPAETATFPVDFVLPAFGNAAGKIFLAQSSWPYNTSNKQITYRLFHHHGDAFLNVYSEVPQNLTVNHATTLQAGLTSISVTADDASFIALTVNGEIIATADGTGSALSITIPGQNSGDVVRVTITKQNYYRYEADVDVIVVSGPYVSYSSHSINDVQGNNNGSADFNEDILLNMILENSGQVAANSVNAILSTTDPYITILDNAQTFGTIAANGTVSVDNAFFFSIANNIPDQHIVNFDLQITGIADETWDSSFAITVNAPALSVGSITIDDSANGNGNGKLDPDETVDIIIQTLNVGNINSPYSIGSLLTSNADVTINNSTHSTGIITTGNTANSIFNITISASAPIGAIVELEFSILAGNYTAADSFTEIVGQIPVCIIDLDLAPTSGIAMQTSLDNLGIINEYYTSIPVDLTIYNTLFICLGIYSDNYALLAEEGQIFADFLNADGNIYMEGGDTWAYDTQTAVHSMFGLTDSGDGTADLDEVTGIDGTFSQGLYFNYSGENSFIDHIDATAPAENIFENTSVGYNCTVAYDAGSYKTIGSSFEFGGLDDALSPSTKDELMEKYMIFFGLLPPAPAFSLTPSSLDFGVVATGASSTKQFKISNTGSVELSGNITTPDGYSVSTADDELLGHHLSNANYKIHMVHLLLSRLHLLHIYNSFAS